MFKVSKRMEISAMHHLNLDYESPCTNCHGHNWIITVEVSGRKLNECGMLMDFKRIKEIVHGKMDHQNLNQVFGFNPTAENICQWVEGEVSLYLAEAYRHWVDKPYCSKVVVQESEGNIAQYEVER